MIRNDREYRITRAQAARFEEALRRLRGSPQDADGVHPLPRKAQEDALASQLDDLRAELLQYDELRSGARRVLELGSLEDLPRGLIQARIASGLTQKQLAERLGLKEQQVQKYEATDYSTASLARLRAVVRALGIQVRQEIVFPSG